jgi:predicted DNA-binding transcriptional regulator AlpA
MKALAGSEAMSLSHHLDADAWYRARDLALRWKIHEMTVWRWAAQGKIPKPVKFGAASRWKGAAIIEFERKLTGDE